MPLAGYLYKRQITVHSLAPAGVSIPVAQMRFPVSGLSPHESSTDGNGMRVSKNQQDPLIYCVKNYSAGSGIVEFLAGDQPSDTGGIQPGDNVYWLFYGNPSPTDASSASGVPLSAVPPTQTLIFNHTSAPRTYCAYPTHPVEIPGKILCLFAVCDNNGLLNSAVWELGSSNYAAGVPTFSGTAIYTPSAGNAIAATDLTLLADGRVLAFIQSGTNTQIGNDTAPYYPVTRTNGVWSDWTLQSPLTGGPAAPNDSVDKIGSIQFGQPIIRPNGDLWAMWYGRVRQTCTATLNSASITLVGDITGFANGDKVNITDGTNTLSTTISGAPSGSTITLAANWTHATTASAVISRTVYSIWIRRCRQADIASNILLPASWPLLGGNFGKATVVQGVDSGSAATSVSPGEMDWGQKADGSKIRVTFMDFYTASPGLWKFVDLVSVDGSDNPAWTAPALGSAGGAGFVNNASGSALTGNSCSAMVTADGSLVVSKSRGSALQETCLSADWSTFTIPLCVASTVSGTDNGYQNDTQIQANGPNKGQRWSFYYDGATTQLRDIYLLQHDLRSVVSPYQTLQDMEASLTYFTTSTGCTISTDHAVRGTHSLKAVGNVVLQKTVAATVGTAIAGDQKSDRIKISFWLWNASGQTAHGFLDSGGHEPYIAETGSAPWNCTYNNGSGSITNAFSTPATGTLPIGQWDLIELAVDLPAKKYYLSVNGVYYGTGTYTGTLTGILSSIYLGDWVVQGTSYIDDFECDAWFGGDFAYVSAVGPEIGVTQGINRGVATGGALGGQKVGVLTGGGM